MVPGVRQAIALLLVVLSLGLSSCGGDKNTPTELLAGFEAAPTTHPLVGAIAEVSPPERIQQLKPYLDVYEPQVRIVSPHEDETLTSTTATIELQVRDFSIYKNADLGLGPHLHLFLDDQRYQAVYDSTAPIVFENLAPGTHTLRVFASRPWHESFKNEGAYDQVSFNVFTPSRGNKPDDSQPLLTYSRPEGRYGAEPIMLDFYLTNAPLHEVAQASETLPDWRIRCTVNGESFVFDRWQPIYLTGFQPGTNWIKLEVIDEAGNLIDNAFNPSIRVIDYAPGGTDGLSRLIRGEIPLAQAKVLVDPNYEPPAPVVEPPAAPEPAAEAAPAAATPAATATPSATPKTPIEEKAPAVEPPGVTPAEPGQPEPDSPAPAPEAPAVEETEPIPSLPISPSAPAVQPLQPHAESLAPPPAAASESGSPGPDQAVPNMGEPLPQEGGRSRTFRKRVTAPPSPAVAEPGAPEPPATTAEPPAPLSPETAADTVISPPAGSDQAPNLPSETPPTAAAETPPPATVPEPDTAAGDEQSNSTSQGMEKYRSGQFV